MIRPWDIKYNPLESREETNRKRWAFWKDMEAHDFYFCVLPQTELFKTTVLICPIAYFGAKDDMIRESMPIVHLVPNYLIETLESIFETDFNEVLVNNDLIRHGFQHNDKFSDYIHHRFEFSKE